MSLLRAAGVLLQRGMDSVISVGWRAVEHYAESGVSARRILVAVRPGGRDAFELEATYVLSGPDRHQGRSLVFVVPDVPLRMLSAKASAGQLETDAMRIPGSATAFRFDPTGESWDGETVRIRATWTPASSVRCLTLPQGLPHVLGQPTASSRSKLMLEVDPQCRLLLGGVSCDRDASPQMADELLEAALVSEASTAGHEFIVTGRLKAQLGAAAEDFTRRASEDLEHLRNEFGEAGARFAWLAEDERRTPDVMSGCCEPVSTEGSYEFALSFLLSSIWWRGGCRFVGEDRLLVENALCEFSLMHIVGLHYPEFIGRARQALLDEMSLGFSRALTYRLEEGHPKQVARLALSIYEASRRDISVVRVVREIADSGWGTYVPAAGALKRLEEAGVEVR